METKFKIGDRVKVKSFKWYNDNKDEYNNVSTTHSCFNSGMCCYCGKETIIDAVNEFDLYILRDCDSYIFDDEMLEDSVISDINVYIYGHPERGAEVIKMLEDKGGVNTGNNSGVFEDYIYLINPDDNSITCFNVSSLSILKLGRTELKLPEIKEVKEPEFKPFERVLVRDEDDEFWQVSLYSHYASGTR